MRAFDVARNTPWAMTEGALTTLLRIAARRDLDPDLVAAKLNAKMAGGERAGQRGSVAVLDVDGPIFRHANMFTDISGGTSTELLARDLTAALENPSVASILLNIDSPGGEANGIHEFAAMIHAGRAVKPITAYVSNLGASAAYWIAAAASEIVCDEMALLGSIGVVAAVPNPHAEDDTDLTFVSSQSPLKRPDPTTEAGKTEIQRTLDGMATIFIQRVATYRGTTPETVAAKFGQGGLLLAREAIKAGMADSIGSFEQTVARMQAPGIPAKAGRTSNAKGKQTMAKDTETTITAEGEIDVTALQTQLAEMQARIEASDAARLVAEAQALALGENVAKLESSARRKRLTDEVLGHANDGTRWLGATDDNVTYLEDIAEVFGEDSPRFTAIVQHHRTLAAQFRASTILDERGSALPETTMDATARLNAAASALMTKDTSLNLAEAKAQAVAADAELRAALTQKGGK